jgi:tRNA(Ile)-lysidine synthase TilS/MesJ
MFQSPENEASVYPVLKSDFLTPISNNSIVVVAMSGGVDSSVAANLLAQSVGIAVSCFRKALSCN